jgi:hypothetical protein
MQSDAMHGSAGTIYVIGFFSCIFGLLWLVSHAAGRYSIQLAGELSDNRNDILLVEDSWWGLKTKAYPIRLGKEWQIYRNQTWEDLPLGIEDRVVLRSDSVELQFPVSNDQTSPQFKAALENSKARAIQRYPDCADPKSQFSKKMVEIADRLETEGSNLVYQPESPERIADMVAGDLKITPKQ